MAPDDGRGSRLGRRISQRLPDLADPRDALEVEGVPEDEDHPTHARSAIPIEVRGHFAPENHPRSVRDPCHRRRPGRPGRGVPRSASRPRARGRPCRARPRGPSRSVRSLRTGGRSHRSACEARQTLPRSGPDPRSRSTGRHIERSSAGSWWGLTHRSGSAIAPAPGAARTARLAECRRGRRASRAPRRAGAG